MIQEVLLSHGRDTRSMDADDRERYVDNRGPAAYEHLLQLDEPEEGVTNAHVFQIILNRLLTLQKRVQIEAIKKRKEGLQKLSNKIAEVYEEMDRVAPGSSREDELADELHGLQTQLKGDADGVESASRMRINNFAQTNNGKNTASSFHITRDFNKKTGISKLITEGGAEITDAKDIEQMLRGSFVATVGSRFEPTRSLGQFLGEMGVELPVLEEASVQYMEKDVTVDELKDALANAKTDSAPGPSGQTIAIFKYIFSQTPVTFTKAINELIFVPGLIKHPMFAWLQDRKVVYIPKPGKAPDRVGALRPLSLLETMYKILTRTLSMRMAETMDEVLHPDQHGFRRDRGIQTATVPVLEAIKDAERLKRVCRI